MGNGESVKKPLPLPLVLREAFAYDSSEGEAYDVGGVLGAEEEGAEIKLSVERTSEEELSPPEVCVE